MHMTIYIHVKHDLNFLILLFGCHPYPALTLGSVVWPSLNPLVLYYLYILNKNKILNLYSVLQEYPAYEYGWSLTPVLPEHRPSNYIEWVLFEGQLLRNQQRVIRELRVFNDWSVEIYTLGKRIHVKQKYTLQRTHSCVVKVGRMRAMYIVQYVLVNILAFLNSRFAEI